jgi:polyisoprenyl-phosphate glycosyltransferase
LSLPQQIAKIIVQMQLSNSTPPLRLSVVAPCYNESEVINELYARVTDTCRKLFGDDYEFILVNDGSRDSTWVDICRLADADPNVVGVNLSRNHGHQLALSAGLSICRGSHIFTLDADLQNPPELLGPMLDLMDEGADVVYGQRNKRMGETWFKKASARAFYGLLLSLVEMEIPTETGDFRLMSRRALDILNSMPEHHRFIRGMVSWIGLRQVPLVYDGEPRAAGVSKYPLSKMLRFALDGITGFSIRPLRVASYLGFLFGATGMSLLLYAFYSWISGSAVTGWTSLIMVVLLLGSTQLFVLGIIGEYLGRLYIESKRRPLFVIDTVYQLETQKHNFRPMDDAVNLAL